MSYTFGKRELKAQLQKEGQTTDCMSAKMIYGNGIVDVATEKSCFEVLPESSVGYPMKARFHRKILRWKKSYAILSPETGRVAVGFVGAFDLNKLILTETVKMTFKEDGKRETVKVTTNAQCESL